MPIVGWSEWVDLPQLGIFSLLAKMDSGARSSALHVEEWHCEAQEGIDRVRFLLPDTVAGVVREYDLPVADRRWVTSSNGASQERIFISTILRLGHWQREVMVSLSQRNGLSHPMLVGRSALAGDWLIDPAQRFVLGDKP